MRAREPGVSRPSFRQARLRAAPQQQRPWRGQGRLQRLQGCATRSRREASSRLAGASARRRQRWLSSHHAAVLLRAAVVRAACSVALCKNCDCVSCVCAIHDSNVSPHDIVFTATSANSTSFTCAAIERTILPFWPGAPVEAQHGFHGEQCDSNRAHRPNHHPVQGTTPCPFRIFDSPPV